MKKNIVIIILSVVILGLGGYLVYDKVIEKDNEEKGVNKEVVKEEAYDLALAKELVDKYYVEYQVGSSFNQMSETDMFKVVFKKAQEDYICTDLYTDDERATIYEKNLSGEPYTYQIQFDDKTSVICGKESHIVSYDNMNKIYKELYGKNLNIEKKHFGSRPTFFYYDSKHNVFALSVFYGGSGYQERKIYGIKSAKIIEGQLLIDIGYEEFKPCDDDNIVGQKYCNNLKGIIYDTSMDDKKFIEDNLDKFDTYRFVFEKEDEHYILSSYVKVLK